MATNITESGDFPIMKAANMSPLSAYQVLVAVFLGYVALNRYQYWKRTVCSHLVSIYTYLMTVVNVFAQPKVMPLGFGPLPWLGPWIGTVRLLQDPVKLIREGMAKSSNGLMRIATIQGEYVLVSDRNKVAEYLRAPDSVLNAQEGANDVSFRPRVLHQQ
jgi:hypothetical protein